MTCNPIRAIPRNSLLGGAQETRRFEHPIEILARSCGAGTAILLLQVEHSHGRGVRPGAKGGNGVGDGEGVAVDVCACALAKKAIKPTRTHRPTIAIPNRIRVFIAEVSSTSNFMSIMAALNHKAPCAVGVQGSLMTSGP